MPPTPMTAKLALAALLLLAPVAGAKEMEVAAYLHDTFHILPEVIQAEPGDVLRLQVTNQGVAPHDIFFCGDAGLGAPPHSCSTPLGGPVRPAPNATLPLSVTVPAAAGTYWYYCTIAGHAAQGMAGKLVVSGETATPPKESPVPAFLALAGLAAAAVLLSRRRA